MNSHEIERAKKFTYVFIALSVFILMVVPFIRDLHKKDYVFTKLQMGTIVEITLKKDDRISANKAFEEIDRLEKIFSSYIDTSDITRINTNAGGEPVKVSPEVIEVLLEAKRISELSGGAFDITMGAMGGLWKITEGGEVPPRSEVEKRLKFVDYKDVIIDEYSGRVKLRKEGMRIYLGGISKGYIVGKAIEVLKSRGVSWGMVHAGGDMFLFNNPKESKVKKHFNIGIQHPRDGAQIIASIKVREGAVSTSGDYERFFEQDGIRYHHILDPETGYPATRSQSVTVVTSNPMLADALSTAVFVMGADKGIKMVENIKGVEALVIDSNGNIQNSMGLEFKTGDAVN